jgi:thymidylate synthase
MLSTVQDIRKQFADKYKRGEIVVNDTGSLSGSDTVEILGAAFIANEPAIFGNPNLPYIKRELDWYVSQSLNVNDIPGGPPAIWKSVATSEGVINSNYGYLVFNAENFLQAHSVILTLKRSPSSRQATMIYTRPTMHADSKKNGMSDFVCTNAVQYIIRDNRLNVIVQMRSNDAIFGYANDYAWQAYMQKFVLDNLNLGGAAQYELGDIFWQVASLHIYQKHFYYLDAFIRAEDQANCPTLDIQPKGLYDN